MTNVSYLIGRALSPSHSELEKTLESIARCPVATIEERCPPQMMQEHRGYVLRERLLGEHINDRPTRCGFIEILEIISRRIGPKSLEDFRMSPGARVMYRAD